MNSLINILKQPFPIHLALKFRLQITLGFSVFVTIFMLYFDPIRVIEIPEKLKVLAIFSYGAICFILLGLDMITAPWVLGKQIREGNWKVYKHILATIWLFIRATIIILVFNFIVGISEFTLDNFFYTLANIVAITMLPTIIAVLVLYNYELRLNLRSAALLNEAIGSHVVHTPDKEDSILFKDTSESEILNLLPSQVLMIKSADNYVEIYWKRGDKTERELLRQTLVSIEQDLLSLETFFRCHRTSIVNVDKIKHVEGNSTGTKLLLEGIDELVPVSRDRRKKLLRRLTSSNNS